MQSGLGGVGVGWGRTPWVLGPSLRSVMGSGEGTQGWSLGAAVPAPGG